MIKIVNGEEIEMTADEIEAWEAYQAASMPTLDLVREAKLSELAEKRWRVEIGGIELAGVPVRTDANSQAKVTAAYTMARLDPGFAVSTWEAAPGLFVPLSNSQLIAIGDAVREHVQATFDRKAVLHAAIMLLTTIADLQAFDIDTAW